MNKKNPLGNALDALKKGEYGPIAIQALLSGGQGAYLSTINTITLKGFIDFQHSEAYGEYTTSLAAHLVQDERWRYLTFLMWYYRGDMEQICHDLRAYEKPVRYKVKVEKPKTDA